MVNHNDVRKERGNAMTADTNKAGPFAGMETVAWADVMWDDKLQRGTGEPLHFVIVDYGIGGEAKAYAQLMEVNKSLPQVTAELVPARDFTHKYKAQLYASDRRWGLVHIRGTLCWYGHGAWITPTDGNLIAWHGGAGDRGWCAPQDPGMVYTTDPNDPQIANSYSYLRGLAEVLEKGSPLDYPKRIFIADDTCDSRELGQLVKRVKELVKEHDIKIVLRQYGQMIMKVSGDRSDVFIGLEKDRQYHETLLNTERAKMRGEIKSGPKKPLEGIKGDRGCCGRTRH